MMIAPKSTIKHYLSLPYTRAFSTDEDGDTVANIKELRGCSAHGKTVLEANANLDEALELWITDALERGHDIPVPKE